MRVTLPNGSWRERSCRYVSGKDLTMTMDPVKSCRATYGITWSADPYWSGEPIEVGPFVYHAGADFFPGPPFTLAPSQVLGSAEVAQPRRRRRLPAVAHRGPVLRLHGRRRSLTVTSTLTLTAGHWVEIDMRPERLTVIDDLGNDRWSTLTDARFSSIPPGDSDLATTLPAHRPARRSP